MVLGGSLTYLMRGTLSSVQHKEGPLCKYSFSSHDWLYNLQKKGTNTDDKGDRARINDLCL